MMQFASIISKFKAISQQITERTIKRLEAFIAVFRLLDFEELAYLG